MLFFMIPFFLFSKLLLLANLLENLLTSLSRETSAISADISAVQASASPTNALDLKRTMSSSSGQDHVETESLPSETVSSAVFSQIQQVRDLNSLKWFRLTCLSLPRGVHYLLLPPLHHLLLPRPLLPLALHHHHHLLFHLRLAHPLHLLIFPLHLLLFPLPLLIPLLHHHLLFLRLHHLLLPHPLHPLALHHLLLILLLFLILLSLPLVVPHSLHHCLLLLLLLYHHLLRFLPFLPLYLLLIRPSSFSSSPSPYSSSSPSSPYNIIIIYLVNFFVSSSMLTSTRPLMSKGWIAISTG